MQGITLLDGYKAQLGAPQQHADRRVSGPTHTKYRIHLAVDHGVVGRARVHRNGDDALRRKAVVVGEEPEGAILPARNGWEGDLASLKIFQLVDAGIITNQELEQIRIKNGEQGNIFPADHVSLDKREVNSFFREQGHVFR